MNILYLILGLLLGILMQYRYTKTFKETREIKINFYVNGRKLSNPEEIKGIQKFIEKKKTERTIH